MSLRALSTGAQSSDALASGAVSLVEPREDRRAFDLAAHAKELESSLRLAREQVRVAEASIAAVRGGVGERMRVVDEASAALAAERDVLRGEIDRANAELAEARAALREALVIRESFEIVAAEREALVETTVALRTAYGAAREGRVRDRAEIETLLGALAAARASASIEREAVAATIARGVEDANRERDAWMARYIGLVDDVTEKVAFAAQCTAEQIEMVQAGRIWRVRTFVARLLGRARTTS
jgi:chromosome segregation ATPase